MKRRQQKLLLGLFCIAGLYFGGEWAYKEYVEVPAAKRRSDLEKAKKAVSKAQSDLKKAKTLVGRLEQWEQRSLTSHTEVARSGYRSWLLDQASAAGLQSPSVESGAIASRKNLFQVLSFSLRGRGNLDSVTRFLFQFYQTDLLHQIQTINLSPVGKSGDLDVSMSVQALALPETPVRESPPRTNPALLAQTGWEAYQVIPQRNIFGLGGSLDPADRTVLTAVTATNGVPEVWFTQGQEDKLYKYHPGDEIQFGRFHGKLTEVLQEDVVLEWQGTRWLLSIGENFGEALPLPPD